MNRIKYIFALPLLALLCVSCEDDIMENSPTGETEGTESVTFTATVDYTIEEYGNGAKASTRATANTDDKPTHFYAQAIDEKTLDLSQVVEGVPSGDNYTFTIPSLTTGTQYTFMFWADNATDYADPTDLRSILYMPGNIAFAANAEGTPASVEKNITLKHVVTKVTLRSTTDATLTESKEVTLATTYATTYDVQNLRSSGNEQHTYTATLTESSIAQNGEALSCYFIPAFGAQDVTVGANLLTQTITSVTLAPNSHVILQGDLSESNPNWEATDAYKIQKLKSLLFKDGEPIGTKDGPKFIIKGTEEQVNALIRYITRNPDFRATTTNQFIIDSDDVACYVFFYSSDLPPYGGIVYYRNNSPIEWYITNQGDVEIPTPPQS